MSYKRENVQSMEQSRQYSSGIPDFLKNRPRRFLVHCLNRLPPNVALITSRDMNELCNFYQSTVLTSYLNTPIFLLDYEIINNSQNTVFTTTQDEEVEVEETNKNEESIRKFSLCLLSQIESALYTTEDLQVLESAFEKLTNLSNYLTESIPKMAGLPYRKRKKRWQRRSGAAQRFGSTKKRKATHSSYHVEQEVCEPSLNKQSDTGDNHDKIDSSNMDPELSVLQHDHFSESGEKTDLEFDALQQVVDEIWNGKDTTTGTALVRVGPYTISDTSIRHLKGAISDEVIDAYLHLISSRTESRVLHINCITMTAIFTGLQERHGLLRKDKIETYDCLVGAMNEDSNHWTLMCFPETTTHGWYNKCSIGSWSMTSPKHAKQTDGISCGIYVIQLAENYLSGKPLLFKWTRSEIVEKRRRIARFLLSESEFRVEDSSRSTLQMDEDHATDNSTQNDPTTDDTTHNDPTEAGQNQNQKISNWKLNDTIVSQLMKIAECSDKKCNNQEHIRHHQFLIDPLEVISKEKKFCGFGLDIFSADDVENIALELSSVLMECQLFDKRKVYSTFRFNTLKGLDKKSTLHSIFVEYPMLALNYMQSILVKELMIKLFMITQNLQYNVAAEVLERTEIKIR
ncbi:hypothetical protein ScPMuIL_011601 [Solemya velum]